MPATPFPKFRFEIDVNLPGTKVRAGRIATSHGVIETPAFIPVATQAALKGVTPEAAKAVGTQAVFANTFHLHLSPGETRVRSAGGLHKFMNWPGPIMTDSGGFQVFSLGVAYGQGVSKVAGSGNSAEFLPPYPPAGEFRHDQKFSRVSPLVKIDDDGVTFRSPLDGSEHRFTAERSIAIQQDLGADVIFAFDECLSPAAPVDYQRAALERTHRWAKRSLDEHRRLFSNQALFGIVQGGRERELREKSARVIGEMDFNGFGLGGSFAKADIDTAVGWVTAILPPSKPRHLLGIGAVEDIFAGVRAGADTFDCVIPTRLGRHGAVETKRGRLNLSANCYRADFSPIENDCACFTCERYSRAYLRHLFATREMLGPILASLHNLHFFNQLLREIRQAILENRLGDYTRRFLLDYTGHPLFSLPIIR